MDDFGVVREVNYDSRIDGLNEDQLRKISNLDSLIEKHNTNSILRKELLMEREIYLQGWSGYPKVSRPDDKEYDVFREWKEYV